METDTYIEIDLELFTKQELLAIILVMHNKGMTFNDYICYVLKTFLEQQEKNGKP